MCPYNSTTNPDFIFVCCALSDHTVENLHSLRSSVLLKPIVILVENKYFWVWRESIPKKIINNNKIHKYRKRKEKQCTTKLNKRHKVPLIFIYFLLREIYSWQMFKTKARIKMIELHWRSVYKSNNSITFKNIFNSKTLTILRW